MDSIGPTRHLYLQVKCIYVSLAICFKLFGFLFRVKEFPAVSVQIAQTAVPDVFVNLLDSPIGQGFVVTVLPLLLYNVSQPQPEPLLKLVNQ